MRLHIGGEVRKDGWVVLNALPGPHVDLVGDCRVMKEIGDASVDEIYASHVLEHLSHAEEVGTALLQWHRVLRPGGRLRVSVPDLATLCWMFVRPGVSAKLRIELMKVIYGGHLNAFDIHYAGFDAGLLGGYLLQAGFERFERVESFGEFADTSEYRMAGIRISLNAQAWKPAA